MKWPLRYQIMIPMMLLTLAAVVGMSAFAAWQAARQQLRATEARLRDVARTLSEASFPLTDSVLRQMKGLAGAEFVLSDPRGGIAATTRREWQATDLPAARGDRRAGELLLGDSVSIGNEQFLHAAINARPLETGQGQRLHVFYPLERYRQERRDAIYPTLALGGLSALLAAVAAMLLAGRISRPLGRLQGHVEHIAEGRFEPMPLPQRNDEIRELTWAVNRMAEMLAQYEQKIRQTEQVRTLGQLGGALAHQLRNAATGARMALDLHNAECPVSDQDESLDVAKRQLEFMEKYLKKFLALGTRQRRAPQTVDLVPLIEQLLPLVRPAARHAGVELQVELPPGPLLLQGEPDGLEHLVLNLVLNAIEASSAAACAEASADVSQVLVAVRQEQDARVRLLVEDTGSGPLSAVADSLFQPFVTSKRDGVGLGLAIARQVVEDHAGTIAWQRRAGRTQFVVELPLHTKEGCRVEVARG